MRVKPFFKKKYASNQIEISNQSEMFHAEKNVPRRYECSTLQKIIEKKVDRTKKIVIL